MGQSVHIVQSVLEFNHLHRVCVCSDSEMEIEAEHYTNGVVEGSSARIMNGTYKHEEILQPDDNSIGNGVTGTHTHTDTRLHRQQWTVVSH